MTDSRFVTDIAGLCESSGRQLGCTAWQEMTQAQVDQFLGATHGHHPFQVGQQSNERARIDVPRYLVLSLMVCVIFDLMKVTDAAVVINYGLDRVRFPGSLSIGTRWRGCAEISGATPTLDGVQLTIAGIIEVEGSQNPACAAECVLRFSR